MFYGINKRTPSSLAEIGKKFDLSRERVRQVKQKAINRLKSKSRSSVLQTYLG